MAFSFSNLCVQVTLPSPLPGRLVSINGIAYVILTFTGELLPQCQDKVFTISQPALSAGVALLLVIKGAKPPAPDAALSSAGD
jgi:hypothetical protein